MESTKILLRFLWMPISLSALSSILDSVVRVTALSAALLLGDAGTIHLNYSQVRLLSFGILATLASVYLIAEIANIFSHSQKPTRLLTHLRFGPLVVIVLASVITFAVDAMMIETSKYQIRDYVFNSGQSIVKPQLRLHNNYRHWCGNGYSAWENYLYFTTAASGISDDDPYVRARSLLMAADVGDFINGGDQRFLAILEAACSEVDPVVTETIETHLQGWRSSCTRRNSGPIP